MDDKPMVTPIAPGYPQPQQPGGYYPPPPQAPRRSMAAGCFAIATGLGLAFSLLLNLLLLGSKGGGMEGTQTGPSAYHEKVIEGEGDAKIAVIRVEGVIAEHQESGGLFGGAGGESLPKKIHDQLDKARKDDAVKAVILDVDSPGGTVTASDQIWKVLIQFRDEKPTKPLVVHQGALAASGGYYISAAGDYIFAEPTTITGSIGVIMQGLNFNKLMKDHGVTDMTITSGPNKALLSPFGEPQEEHRKILQETVDDMYGRFCDVVADGMAHRTGKKKEDLMPEVKKLADGRIYTAKQALDLKLVDAIGYVEDAVDYAKKKAGVTTAKLVRYTKQPSFMDVLSGNMDAKLDLGRGVTIKVDPRVLDDLQSPRFLMLWRGE